MGNITNLRKYKSPLYELLLNVFIMFLTICRLYISWRLTKVSHKKKNCRFFRFDPSI